MIFMQVHFDLRISTKLHEFSIKEAIHLYMSVLRSTQKNKDKEIHSEKVSKCFAGKN